MVGRAEVAGDPSMEPVMIVVGVPSDAVPVAGISPGLGVAVSMATSPDRVSDVALAPSDGTGPGRLGVPPDISAPDVGVGG